MVRDVSHRYVIYSVGRKVEAHLATFVTTWRNASLVRGAFSRDAFTLGCTPLPSQHTSTPERSGTGCR